MMRWQGIVVDLSGRSLDGTEHDVLVEAGDHARRQLARRSGCAGSSHSRAAAFFQAAISSSRSVPSRPRAAVNSFMRRFRPALRVVGLAVVAVGARERDEVGVGARRACRPRRSRSSSSPRTTRCPASPQVPGPAPVERGAVRVGAVLDQEDALGAAERGDPLDVERDVPADVHEERRPRAVRGALASKSAKEAQRSSRLQSTNTTSAPAACDRERRGHERVRRAEHRLAAYARELERCERGTRPARQVATRRQAVPRLPGRLERLDQRALRPALASRAISSQSSCSRARSR